MAPHSSTLAWKLPWKEEPGRLQSMGSQESDTTERLHFHFSLSHIGEGNGNPLQCSCLENPGDRGAWWAAIYGVAQSQTRLKQLSSSSSSILQKSIGSQPPRPEPKEQLTAGSTFYKAFSELIGSPQPPSGKGILIPILQMRKQKLREQQ